MKLRFGLDDRKTMATYLLTWNERKKPWNELDNAIKKTAEGKPHLDWWNVRAHRRISPGDRVFVLKQGKEPRGIFASGEVTSKAYQRKHWDPAKKGTEIQAVDVSLDTVIHPSEDQASGRAITNEIGSMHFGL